MSVSLDTETLARNAALLARVSAMTVSEVKALADSEGLSATRISELSNKSFLNRHPNADVYMNRILGNLGPRELREVFAVVKPKHPTDVVGPHVQADTLSARHWHDNRVSVQDTRERLRLKLLGRKQQPGAAAGR